MELEESPFAFESAICVGIAAELVFTNVTNGSTLAVCNHQRPSRMFCFIADDATSELGATAAEAWVT